MSWSAVRSVLMVGPVVAGCGLELQLPVLPDFAHLAPDDGYVAARDLVAQDLAALRAFELFETDGLVVTDAMRPELCATRSCREDAIDRFVAQSLRLHGLVQTVAEVSDDPLLQCSVYVYAPERDDEALHDLAALRIVHVGPLVVGTARHALEQEVILCGVTERLDPEISER